MSNWRTRLSFPVYSASCYIVGGIDLFSAFSWLPLFGSLSHHKRKSKNPVLLPSKFPALLQKIGAFSPSLQKLATSNEFKNSLLF